MRISDWSSDVCSSDLVRQRTPGSLLRQCAPPFRMDGRLRCRCPEIRVRRPQGRGPTYLRNGARPAHGRLGRAADAGGSPTPRSEEHTSELQSLMRISYAVFCLKTKTKTQTQQDVTYMQLY